MKKKKDSVLSRMIEFFEFSQRLLHAENTFLYLPHKHENKHTIVILLHVTLKSFQIIEEIYGNRKAA